MAIRFLQHVQLAMPAGEEDQARRFYGDLLGMMEVPKPENLARRGGCWFESGDAKVHLGVEEDFHPARKAHPAFVVDNLEELRSKLAAAGIFCKNEEPPMGFDQTYVSDPFGNRIELMQAL